jgi:pimeloyl-ACP methyl ester carboxylesterase
LSKAESDLLEHRANWDQAEGGYEHLQGTKPQTLSYALNDSPVGLASWIMEKFRSWSDCGGQIESRFTKDELLTNIMIYWVTQTIGSSARLYYETRKAPWFFNKGDRISVPTAITIFPRELSTPPREWAERLYNVTHWTAAPRGGHFAATEEPAFLAQEIRRFFKQFRR